MRLPRSTGILIHHDGETTHVNSDFPYTHSQYVFNAAHDASAHGDFVDFLSDAACSAAYSAISAWDGYKPTALVSLTDVAAKAFAATSVKETSAVGL